MLSIKLFWTGLLYWFCLNTSGQTYQASLAEGSSFVLKGSSNVSDFKLTYAGTFGGNINAEVNKNQYEMNIKANRSLNLKVEAFKSTNAYITKDFQKMLQAEAYPDLVIEPISVWQQKGRPGIVCALIALTIAGNRKTETIFLNLKGQKENAIVCAGAHKISLKKYSLTAPKKAFGAIQVKDEVIIDMVLNLQYKKMK